jgi:hypothetical protein
LIARLRYVWEFVFFFSQKIWRVIQEIKVPQIWNKKIKLMMRFMNIIRFWEEKKKVFPHALTVQFWINVFPFFSRRFFHTIICCASFWSRNPIILFRNFLS